jgi:hypothetical protein
LISFNDSIGIASQNHWICYRKLAVLLGKTGILPPQNWRFSPASIARNPQAADSQGFTRKRLFAPFATKSLFTGNKPATRRRSVKTEGLLCEQMQITEYSPCA